MTKPESLPVEEARKKFADILDGTQFRSTHTEITRHGKAAGVVVPPEWYLSITREVEELRRKVEELGAPNSGRTPALPAPAKKVAPAPEASAPPQQTEPSGRPGLSPEVAALSYEQARDLFRDAETRHVQWAFRMRRTLGTVPTERRAHLGVQAGVDEGLITLPGQSPTTTEEQTG